MSQVKYQTYYAAKLTVPRLTPGNYKSLVRTAKTLQKSFSHEEFQVPEEGHETGSILRTQQCSAPR